MAAESFVTVERLAADGARPGMNIAPPANALMARRIESIGAQIDRSLGM